MEENIADDGAVEPPDGDRLERIARREALKKAMAGAAVAGAVWAAPRVEGLTFVPDLAAAATTEPGLGSAVRMFRMIGIQVANNTNRVFSNTVLGNPFPTGPSNNAFSYYRMLETPGVTVTGGTTGNPAPSPTVGYTLQNAAPASTTVTGVAALGGLSTATVTLTSTPTSRWISSPYAAPGTVPSIATTIPVVFTMNSPNRCSVHANTGLVRVFGNGSAEALAIYTAPGGFPPGVYPVTNPGAFPGLAYPGPPQGNFSTQTLPVSTAPVPATPGPAVYTQNLVVPTTTPNPTANNRKSIEVRFTITCVS